ncbi:MAG: DUF4870 domain-containing protein [Nodosilinea sp.]
MQSTEDTGTRKLLSAVCHGSNFFNTLVVSIGVPIAILLASNDSVVKESAKESINFHLNVWFWKAIAGVLVWLLIGFPLLIAVFLIDLIMPIFGVIHSLTKPDTVFRYPLILRLF